MTFSKSGGKVLLDKSSARENLGRARSFLVHRSLDLLAPREAERPVQCGFAQVETFPESCQGFGDGVPMLLST